MGAAVEQSLRSAIADERIAAVHVALALCSNRALRDGARGTRLLRSGLVRAYHACLGFLNQSTGHREGCHRFRRRLEGCSTEYGGSVIT
jgi:hypothetical protein